MSTDKPLGPMTFRSAMRILALGSAVENEKGVVYWFKEGIDSTLSFFKAGHNVGTDYFTIALIGNEFFLVRDLASRIKELSTI